MYGWKLYSYRTLLDAAQTMVSLQLGIFNYEEVSNTSLILPQQIISTDCCCSVGPFYPTGSELQSRAWCFPHWLLYCVHDVCCAEPLHLSHPCGVQSRANLPQGNSAMQGPKGLNAADVSVCSAVHCDHSVKMIC